MKSPRCQMPPGDFSRKLSVMLGTLKYFIAKDEKEARHIFQATPTSFQNESQDNKAIRLLESDLGKSVTWVSSE